MLHTYLMQEIHCGGGEGRKSPPLSGDGDCYRAGSDGGMVYRGMEYAHSENTGMVESGHINH